MTLQQRRPMTLSHNTAATVLFALIGCLTLAAAPARALDPQVRDDASFFSSQSVEQANTIIRQIKQDHGKDVMVETFPKIPDDQLPQFDPTRKDQFLDKRLTVRAKELGVNGVYILICKDPSRVQVGVGKETRQRAFTEANRD